MSDSRPFTLRRALEVDSGRVTVTSGSRVIDGLLGGGFKTGEMAEVFGGSNTGKTQLAMQTAVLAALHGFNSVFIDTEGQFRPERLASICSGRGVDAAAVLPRVYSVRAETTRRQLEAVVKLRRESGLAGCKLVVVDTLSKNFTLEYGGGQLTGRRQSLLGAYLNMLARDAYQSDRAVILLNRVASITVDGIDKEVEIGGETVRRFAQKVLYLRKSGDYVMASRVDEGTPESRTRINEEGLI